MTPHFKITEKNVPNKIHKVIVIKKFSLYKNVYSTRQPTTTKITTTKMYKL